MKIINIFAKKPSEFLQNSDGFFTLKLSNTGTGQF